MKCSVCHCVTESYATVWEDTFCMKCLEKMNNEMQKLSLNLSVKTNDSVQRYIRGENRVVDEERSEIHS